MPKKTGKRPRPEARLPEPVQNELDDDAIEFGDGIIEDVDKDLSDDDDVEGVMDLEDSDDEADSDADLEAGGNLAKSMALQLECDVPQKLSPCGALSRDVGPVRALASMRACACIEHPCLTQVQRRHLVSWYNFFAECSHCGGTCHQARAGAAAGRRRRRHCRDGCI
jgi:hypothetical protein